MTTCSTENSANLVSSGKFKELREISSTKKTCYLSIETVGISGLAEFKFGQISNLYVKELEISQFLLSSLFNERLISKSLLDYLTSERASLDEIFDCLEEAAGISKYGLDKLRNSFYQEFVSYLLFDGNCALRSISRLSFRQLLDTNEYICALGKLSVSKLEIGQLALSEYSIEKSKDIIASKGNLISGASNLKDTKIVFSELDLKTEIPVSELLSAVPGLRACSVANLLDELESGTCMLKTVVFEDELRGDGFESLTLGVEVKGLDGAKNSSLLERLFPREIISLGFMKILVNVFSLGVGAVIGIKLFNYVKNFL